MARWLVSSFRSPGGSLRATLSFCLRPVARSELVRIQLVHLLALLTDLYLAARVLGQRPRTPLNIACAALCLCFAWWSASLLVAHDQHVSRAGAELAYHLGALAWSSFGSLALLVAAVFLEARRLLRSRLFWAALIIPPLVVMTGQWTGQLASGYSRMSWGFAFHWSNSPLTYFFYAYYLLYCNVTLTWLLRAAWRDPDQRRRRQASWMAYSAMPALALATLTDIVLPRLAIHLVPNMAPDLILTWGLGLSWAITRHGLLSPTPAMAAERILSTMSDAVLILGPGGHVLRANPAAERLLERNEAELLGQRGEALLPGAPPAPTTPDEVIAPVDLDLKQTAGEDHWIQLSTAPLSDGKQVAGAVWVATDISARKARERALRDAAETLERRVEQRTADLQTANLQRSRSEASYQLLIESMHEGVWHLDREHQSVLLNRQLRQLLGGQGEALSAQRPEDLIVEEDRPAFTELLEGSRAGLRDSRQVRLSSGGHTPTVVVTAAPLFDLEGNYDGVVLTVADVTERRQLQARLAQSDRMASIGLLAAGVAHEINNPMSFVYANVELLVEELPALLDADDEKQADLLEATDDALEGAGRVREILKSLRTFSRVDDGQPSRVALDDVIEIALSMTHNQLKYRVQVEHELGAPPPVFANEGRLAQVFINLLVNAAQAFDGGSKQHNLVRVRSWSEAGCAIAEVEDNGRGINADALERLFEPFYTTKAIGEGSGLGLSICQQIVDDYGGSIEVESAPGAGARFRIRLPQAGSGELDALQTPPRARRETRRARVLVIDDEEHLRTVVRRAISSKHDVVCVASGHEAQEILERDQRFDVLLCDLMMPELSGVELFQWICLEHSQLAERVVFMTGGVFTPAARSLFAKVQNQRLDKPFSKGQLLDAIATRLSANDAADETDSPS
jgi:PAS domain S-box-containing protein